MGQLKKILSDWLIPQGVTNYTIKLLFNNGTELSNVVFQSNTYDNIDFKAQANLLLGGSIRVEVPVVPIPATAAKFEPTELIYVARYDDDDLAGFRTLESAYEWLVYRIVEAGIELKQIGLSEPVNYKDNEVQRIIDDYLAEFYDEDMLFTIDILE